ncbi:MAG: acylglycerol kinase family protein [Sandaracinaceae bacterium]|nr:acylglycerol kinase family protein [Sandaracinaceae bacterium]
MTDTFFAIVNGAAGGGRCRARADQATRRLRDAGVKVEVHLTEGRGHASELAEDAYDAGHRHFIAVGGDGTSYEIVNGLFPARTRKARRCSWACCRSEPATRSCATSASPTKTPRSRPSPAGARARSTWCA